MGFQGDGNRVYRVLLVDDSPAILRFLRLGLSRHPQLEIVDTAPDAYAARDKIKALHPDVITLDVEMPRMNGLDFLERIMRLRPMPVVMLSSITPEGSAAAVRALSLGAVDVLAKPETGLTNDLLEDLAERVVMAAQSRKAIKNSGRGVRPQSTSPANHAQLSRWNGKICLIGASTGGVAAIEKVLTSLPANSPPILISQHMPESFLISFAERLNQKLPQTIGLADTGRPLEPGHVYLAPGGNLHTGIEKRGNRFYCRNFEGPACNGHHPSVDQMFKTAVDHADRVIGVILTGLGKDGAEGLKSLKQEGAVTIGQDERSCVVYGMPRAAADLGAVDQELPLTKIAEAICQLADKTHQQKSRA